MTQGFYIENFKHKFVLLSVKVFLEIKTRRLLFFPNFIDVYLSEDPYIHQVSVISFQYPSKPAKIQRFMKEDLLYIETLFFILLIIVPYKEILHKLTILLFSNICKNIVKALRHYVIYP